MGKFYTYPKQKNIQEMDMPKMVYTIPEITEILDIPIKHTYKLLEEEPFPIIRAVRKKLIPIKPFHKWVEANYPLIELPEYKELPAFLKSDKKSYSVPEVRAMLGMKKTSSYEMIKVGTFEIVVINDRIRILRSSFEDWFHSKDYLYINKEEK